jgi:pyruvate/2-oxoglutarate dehydrogenase complex dihydrolipoamide dehydrogenase (E3) component
MADLLTPDICVIGAGSGGLSVAAAAAAFGVPVVLVEKDRMGGECLNTACVPSKALIAAARHAAAIGRGARFGVAGRAEIDFGRVRDHIRDVIATIAPTDSQARYAALGVRVVTGTARFVDAETVAAGEVRVRARRFVIATGSSPAIPPIPGLADVPYLTNESVFDLAACPRHLLVIGAGVVGLELAQAFRRLGAAVTVLEQATPLAGDDPECAAIVLDTLAREGVAVRTGVTVREAQRVDGGVRLLLAGAADAQAVEGSHLLVAAGRRPNVEGLGLTEAGIAAGGEGIIVDKRLRTTNRRVYAIGDVVAGSPRFTHVADYHAARVIRHALFRLPVVADYGTIPRVAFTDPELAQVGLTEAQAKQRGLETNVLRWPYQENDRALADRATRGHIKVVTSKRGRMIGATIVGNNAGELVVIFALALQRRLGVRALAELVVPYPTYANIAKRVAMSYYIPKLTSPLLRRIIALLRRLG